MLSKCKDSMCFPDGADAMQGSSRKQKNVSTADAGQLARRPAEWERAPLCDKSMASNVLDMRLVNVAPRGRAAYFFSFVVVASSTMPGRECSESR
jgi:hypothetical protein